MLNVGNAREINTVGPRDNIVLRTVLLNLLLIKRNLGEGHSFQFFIVSVLNGQKINSWLACICQNGETFLSCSRNWELVLHFKICMLKRVTKRTGKGGD